MFQKIKIYGTINWPYTRKAREAYGEKAVFLDVESDPEKLVEMLKLSNGRKQIPVIVEGEKITVGFGGAWGV